MKSTSLLSPRRAAPAAVAILYPKVGNVLRVPLRRTAPPGAAGCEQHPERQFIVWFNRMAAARPAFPLQIKSILLISDAPLCPSCHRALAMYLSRYHLAGKLRLRSTAPAGCGCATRQLPGDNARYQLPRQIMLSQLIADSELEEEAWWEKAKNLGRAAVLTGALVMGPQGAFKPVYDVAKSIAGAYEKRRKTQQTVDDNTPPSGSRSGQARELVLG
ncbi:hypothetical protein ACVWYF_003419 [Hymenobacter sp. UYAg731]